MPKVSMSVEDYLRLLAIAENPARGIGSVVDGVAMVEDEVKKVKRTATAYQRRYRKAFREIKKRFMTKAGKWKRGGFKAAVKAAHKAARK